MSVAYTSLHLKALRNAQLVDVRRQGLYTYYRLANVHVFSLWQSLRELGTSRLADYERLASYLRESLTAITCQELKRRLDERSVIALDVRPEREYRSRHFAGARSIPSPKGPPKIEEILRANGRKAVRLASGFPDWKAPGLPVDASTAGAN
jgi:rhodanese-like protein